jgi:signal transduction histidine kinase
LAKLMINTMQDFHIAALKPLLETSQQDRAGHHSVQFYSEERFLLEASARFLGAALVHGEAGVVLASRQHRAGIAECLQRQGIDLECARVTGKYVELDADEILSRITVAGHLEEARFLEIMGHVIVKAKAAVGGAQRNLAVFGEAVSILCARGEAAAALELEQFWDKLVRAHSFKLLCAYAANSFDRAADAEVFNKICAAHDHVFPDESFLELPSRSDRLRYIAQLQQKARALATETVERQHAEEALLRSEKLAAVGRLTASIAHEINNPLASLTNLFYLMNTDTSLDPAARHYAALADQELRRTARITKQMLAFHRESASPVPCKLSPIVDGVLELYETRLRKSNITIEKRYDVDGTIEGFAAEMRQLFANLIGNAIEAVGDKGRIRLRVSEGRDWADPVRHGVRVSIADTGAGISVEDQKQIFEPFFTTKGESGTGLGLWVCHGIVQKHGGRIRFRSRPHLDGCPGGTVFSIFLPAATGRADEHHVSPQADVQNALRATG